MLHGLEEVCRILMGEGEAALSKGYPGGVGVVMWAEKGWMGSEVCVVSSGCVIFPGELKQVY